jgi:guanylate kinase
LSQFDDFDYLVINADFSPAADDMVAIVRASRSRREAVKRRHADLITDLLS